MENMIKFLPFHFVLSTDVNEMHKGQPFFCGKILTNACSKKKKKKKNHLMSKLKLHQWYKCIMNI